MEVVGRGEQEDEQERRADPRPGPQHDAQAAEQQEPDGAEQRELGVRHSLGGHVGGGGLELRNLVGDGADDEDRGEKQPRDEREGAL